MSDPYNNRASRLPGFRFIVISDRYSRPPICDLAGTVIEARCQFRDGGFTRFYVLDKIVFYGLILTEWRRLGHINADPLDSTLLYNGNLSVFEDVLINAITANFGRMFINVKTLRHP